MTLIYACAMGGPDNFGNEGTAHGLSAIPRFPYVLLAVWCHPLQLKKACGKNYRIFGNNGEKVVGLKLLCLHVFQSNENSSSFLIPCSLMFLWKAPLKKLWTFLESRRVLFRIWKLTKNYWEKNKLKIKYSSISQHRESDEGKWEMKTLCTLV